MTTPRLTTQHLMLFLIGVALNIAQFVMIRDFVSILYGEEVVIVLVTSSFFLGLSVGYLLSLRLSLGVFRTLFVVSVLLHLTFPFSYRFIASWMAYQDVSGYWFLVLLFGYALVFNTIFATFLPRLISLPSDDGLSEEGRLRIYYGLELAGFMTGFLLIALSWNKPMAHLLIPYWVILGLVLYFALRRVALTVVYAGLAGVAMWHLEAVDLHSTAMLYEFKHHIRGAKTLYSVNSPYQKVEIIENRDGKKYLYLDGLQNLNSTGLMDLNYYIAWVPAQLLRPDNTLLIGNGTLSSVPKVYPYSQHVTSVELDGGVLEGGRRYFTPPEVLSGFDRWRLVVDDGKHFLRESEERYDLVVVDVPSPLTIQEAYLHSREFYQLVGENLTDQGVLAVQLSGPLQENNRTPARVTAALRTVFPEVLVIYSERASRGFAYASRSLPLTGRQIAEHARNHDPRLKVIEPDEVDGYLTEAVPLSVNSLDLVLFRGWERFSNRYLED